jgi:glycosyltransferase involved in cell wall biosynthesis
VRVLVAHNRYRSGAPSGENAAVVDEVALLRGAGIAVDTLSPGSDDIPALSLVDRLGVAAGPVANPRGLRELTAALRGFRPDVLHLHNVYPQVSPWAVRRAHALGVPVVQTVHNYRHSCVAGFRYRDGGPCDDCVGRLLPVPAVAHGCYRGSRLQSVAMATGQAVHRGTWRTVDAYLALTPFMAAELTRLGIPADRVVLRPTAVADPGPPAPLGRNVLFAGRLDEMKGAADLVAAWRRADPPAGARLRVVGSGPLLPALRAAAGGTVDVLGPLPAERVAAEMRDAALVALPSRWYEGQPRVLVEAYAHGRPVLTAGLGSLADVGATGWTGPLAERLAVLHDRAALAAAGAAARTRYLSEHTPAAALTSLLAVYTRLTDRSHSGQSPAAPPAGPGPRRPPGGAAGPGGRGGRPQRPDAGHVGPVAGDLPGAHQLHL